MNGPVPVVAVQDRGFVPTMAEEVHAILRSMQKQCDVRNLVIDPGVEGRGTFLFHNLPCDKAFEVVTSTMGLESRDEGNSVVTVRRRQSR